MSKRFAAARNGRSAVPSRMICNAASIDAANDNRIASRAPVNDVDVSVGGLNDNSSPVASVVAAFDPLLENALRHFARHGLSAAKVAHEKASQAIQAGDTDESDAWSAICDQFDSRLARTLNSFSG